MLQRFTLQGRDSRFTAIEEAGGLIVVQRGADPDEVREAVLEEGARALMIQTPEVDFLEGLPVEFVFFAGVFPHAEAVNGLRELRGLSLDCWEGDLAFERLPRLEWLGVTEVERGQLDGLFERGHEALHHLAIGRYRERDLTPLERLSALTHLSVGDTRALQSLNGIEGLPALRHLDLYRSPKLPSLAGVEKAPSIQHLDLTTCNRITDLTPMGRLPDLRSVQIEMRAPPSLVPLVGHPTLEYLWLVSGRRPAGEEIEGLLENPRLRFLDVGRSTWLRTDGDWGHIPDIYAMSEAQSSLRERLVLERDAYALW